MRKLARIFHDVDVSGDGLISQDEFNGMLEARMCELLWVKSALG